MSCPFLNKFNVSNLRISSSSSSSQIKLEEKNIELYLMQNYDKSLLPKKPDIYKKWWEEDEKTKNHARFCLPLLMANGLGYDILSPATFEIEWDGDENHDAEIKILESTSHAVVDSHSACGSFTIQAHFIPKTEEGCFTLIKGIPNLRRPFSVMEGLIETWWNPANFGIVCLCNHAGKFKIEKGEPIARMLFLNEKYIKTNLIIKDNEFEIYQRQEFVSKREKQTKHVLDYFKGLFPNGKKTNHHFKPSDYK
jgi:hypothetical protein